MSANPTDSTTDHKSSLAVLISGRGSNMLAIAHACRDGLLDAKVDLVISNRADAAGLTAANQLGIETSIIPHTEFNVREAFDHALTTRLQIVNPDWILLAGFMRILTEGFIHQWEGRIINIHPSLLPKYPGLNTHQRAIDAGDSYGGASVHFVTPDLDAGPIICQTKEPILPGDTAESLANRVIKREHGLYIEAMKHCLSDPNA